MKLLNYLTFVCSHTRYTKTTILISVGSIAACFWYILFRMTVHNQLQIRKLFLRFNIRVPGNSHNSVDSICNICIGQISYYEESSYEECRNEKSFRANGMAKLDERKKAH